MALPVFKRGGDLATELTADRLNAICDEIRTCRIMPSSSLLVGRQPGIGTSVEAKRQKGASGLAPLYCLSVGDSTTNKIRVIYGTIGGLTPSGMTYGDFPAYVLSGMTGTGVVYGELDTDDTGAPTTASINFDDTLPHNSDPNGDGTGGNFYFEIGSYTTDDSGNFLVAQNVSGSQAFQYCGGAALWGLI